MQTKVRSTKYRSNVLPLWISQIVLLRELFPSINVLLITSPFNETKFESHETRRTFPSRRRIGLHWLLSKFSAL